MSGGDFVAPAGDRFKIYAKTGHVVDYSDFEHTRASCARQVDSTDMNNCIQFCSENQSNCGNPAASARRMQQLSADVDT
jgi:hypothetical protein